MICDDFRARWSDRDPLDVENRSDDADLAAHRVSCQACAGYADSIDAFDGLFRSALVVPPPPELVARLQQLPVAAGAMAAPSRELEEAHAFGIALEFAALVLVGFGAVALLGNDLLLGWELALGHLGDVLQELSLIAGSPIVPYVQNLAFTGVEALATLLLLVMGFDRVSSGLSQSPFQARAARGNSDDIVGQMGD